MTTRSAATHRALGHRFCLDTESSGAHLLSRALGSLVLVDAQRHPVDAVYGLEIDSTDHAVATRDGAELETGALDGVLSRLVTSINVAGISTCADELVVHAACVAVGDAAIVLPGAPGAGKSTLATALTDAGFGYLSDEAAPLGTDARVRAYPKPIVVGPGSFGALGAAGRADVIGHPRRWFLDPAQLSGGVHSEPATVRTIVVPQRHSGSTVALRALSPAETAAALASNAFNLRSLRRAGLERAAAVARQAPGYTMEYSDAGAATEAVAELVSQVIAR